MNEIELVKISAKKLYNKFPLMKMSEAVKTSWEIVREFRKDNGEPDEEAINKTVKDICGEQN